MRRKKYGSTDSEHPTPLEIVYAFSHIETWLEDYAKSNRLSPHELTIGVVELLHRQTHGAILGLEHRLPEKSRAQAAEGSDALAEMEMARGTRRQVQGVKRKKRKKVSAAGRKRISEARKAWWAAKKAA